MRFRRLGARVGCFFAILIAFGPSAWPQVSPTTLSIGISSTPPVSVAVGGSATYGFTVTNTGAATANNVVFMQGLPSATVADSQSASQGTCSAVGTAVRCNLGNLAPTATVTIDISAIVRFEDPLGQTMVTAAADNAPLVDAFFILSSVGGNQFYFSDFSFVDGLNFVGSASQVGTVVNLTPAVGSQSGAAWFNAKQAVQNGFVTRFKFVMHDGSNPPADGLAFVIQNTSATQAPGGAIAFNLIPNSVAVEFDIFENPALSDPNGNHISVHTKGTAPNDQSESASLGSTTNIPTITNDNVLHEAIIEYTPGRLAIYLDDATRPRLVVPLNLSTTLSLDNGMAYVGFTAGTGGAFTAHDITEWAFSTFNTVNADGSVLYTVTSREGVGGDLLRIVDPLSARVVTAIPMTLAGHSIDGGQGLATDPATGELYGMLFIDGSTAGRELVKINPITGVATSVGNTSRKFAAIAFDCSANLFGLTGDGDSTNPESLFSINKTNAAVALLSPLGNGDDGEALTFHPDDNLFFHASGLTTPIFESVHPTTFLTTDIPITDTLVAFDEAMALTYWKSQGTMLYTMGFGGAPFIRLSPSGESLLIGTLPHQAKGLAFVGGPPPCGPPVIQDGPDLAVSIADSPDPVNAGAAVTYTVDVSDIGTELATGVDLTVSVSGQGALTSYPGSCTGETNSVSCPLGDIAAGTGTSQEFTVTSANGGQISFQAIVSTTATDPVVANNTATKTTVVEDSESDATTEFSTTQNPNGYWSYGWSTSRGSAFNLYTLQTSNGGLEGWHGGTDKPVIVRNVTESVVNTAGTNPIQPGQLAAHPGAAGENNVLRWTAPASGVYQISVTFTGSDTVGTTTDVAVLHGATQLFSGNVNGYGNQQTFSGFRSVNVGGTIDFTLGHGGNGYTFDTTAIDAQVIAGAPQLGSPDTQGTEFWLAFMPNNSSSELSLFITGQTITTGLVEIPALSFSQAFSVTPGTVTTVSIPIGAVNFGSNVTDDLGIHVVAGAEITVYGLNRLTATTDAFLGLPVDILGTEYLVMGYGGGAGSVMTVVATEDNTAVTISQGATSFTPVLNRGQRFQAALADVTGALVTSDKPVAVFGGNRCTNVPSSAFACDHLVEQMPPTVTWGTQFVTMPLATRLNGDTFRILASVDGTTVTVNGTLVATLNRGQFHERIINGPSEIIASQPVLVAQYSNGSSFDNVTSDPFMMLIPPFEQFLNNYTITTPASGFGTNFVNIVTASFAVGAISVDGTPIPANNFVAIGTSGFFGTQVPISLGSHNLTSPFPFGAFVYGFASFDSYGYPGGASQSPIATVDSISLTDLEPGTFEAGTEACFEVEVLDSDEAPVADIRVDFGVTGTNVTSGFDITDVRGIAGFCYTGEFGGEDTVRGSVGALQSSVNKTWTPGQADVVLQALPGPAVSGVNLVYQVRVRNDGPAGASAVVVSDTLTNFQLVAISSTQGGCSGTAGFASCNVGNMRVGTSADITVTVSASGGAGWARHSFSAGGSGIDPDLTNNLKAISFGNNQAPAAVAGANRTVAGISLSGTPVTLDGGASSDPNGDALTYRWTGPFPEGGGLVSGRTPTVTLAFGTSKVSLVVSDGALDSAPSDVLITVSDFGVAVAGGQASIAAGQSASYTVTVSSIHGAFDREVALGCGGLPAFTRCTVSPVKVTPNGTSATATLTITTNATLAANPSNEVHLAWLLVFPVAGLVMFAGQRRRRTWLLGALLALALLQVACGGGGTTTSSMPVNRTPAGVHTITVNASSGALTHSSAVTVTVR